MATGAVAAGVGVTLLAALTSTSVLREVSMLWRGMAIVAARESTTSAMASPHVIFSMVSVVLRTPNTWLGAEKLAARPPPLEFCTNTARAKATHTSRIRMTITVYSVCGVLLYYYFLPMLVLDSRIKKRKKKLEHEAVFFFEVLSLAIESGNNLYASIELTTTNVESELSYEFGRMLDEIKIGKSFIEGLESLSKRIPSDTIKNILLNIKQASLMGNDITDTLKNQLNYIREKKILETRAYIAKIPLKISVISVIFFIPLLLLMILGPVIIKYIG